MTAYKKTLYSSDILLSYVFLQQQQQHSLLSILQQRSHDNGGVSGVYLWVTANSVTCGWLISGVGPTKQKIIRILNTKFLVGKQNTTQVLFNCRQRQKTIPWNMSGFFAVCCVPATIALLDRTPQIASAGPKRLF